MRIYLTGDTHGEFERFTPERFPQQSELTREDLAIICGDFGGVWYGDERDDVKLDFLESLPFTTLFVDGNHENYEELYRLPVGEWHGGKVRRVREHVLHLTRGQVFELGGRRFFTMGGGKSHDVWDGILDPAAEDFAERYVELRRRGAVFRVKYLNWWEQELPSEAEYAEARRNLDRVNWDVDCIITHCAPTAVQTSLKPLLRPDALTEFFTVLRERAKFQYWFFGHYHGEKKLDGGLVLLYQHFIRLM